MIRFLMFLLFALIVVPNVSASDPDKYPTCITDGIEVSFDAYPSRDILSAKNNLGDLPEVMRNSGRYFDTAHFGQIQVGFLPHTGKKVCKGALRLHGAPLQIPARDLVSGVERDPSYLYLRNLEQIRQLTSMGYFKYTRSSFRYTPMLVDRYECVEGGPLDFSLTDQVCNEKSKGSPR